jgi:hypothetical protein
VVTMLIENCTGAGVFRGHTGRTADGKLIAPGPLCPGSTGTVFSHLLDRLMTKIHSTLCAP